jgi:tRNA (guanine-N7-)-methyltransferase
VVSKYEARWKRQEKTIWDVTITSTQNSPEVVLEGNFDFPGKLDIQKIKNDLPKKAVIKEDYLVHFETIYTIDENSFLIKLTLGSFNKPVTKYILINNGTARYFQGHPIKTRSNLDSHKLILEYLT